MKRVIVLLAVAAVAAAVLLRPIPPPAGTAAGWSAASPLPGASGRARRSAPPQAEVYVAGEVVRPGVYAVRPDARVRDALALAGGLRPAADPVAVNLAAHVRDGDEIAVPARGAPSAVRGARGRSGGRASRAAASRPGRRGKHRRSPGAAAPPAAEVDINTASADDLAAIPGIGEGLALRIVAFRQANGPFASVDELLDVAGITEHRLDALIPYVVAR